MKSYSTLKNTKDYKNPEYEILALMEDLKDLQDFEFQTNQSLSECPVTWLNPDGVISRSLNTYEINEFNKLKEKNFIEVFSDPKQGKVFELKNLSFKKVHRNNNK